MLPRLQVPHPPRTASLIPLPFFLPNQHPFHYHYILADFTAPPLFYPIKSNYPRGTYYSEVPVYSINLISSLFPLISLPPILSHKFPNLGLRPLHPFLAQLRINWISFSPILPEPG